MKQLVYPSDDTLATLHRSLITICKQNHWSAILPNTLTHVTKAGIGEGDNPWIAITPAETILHIFMRSIIGQGLQELEQYGSIFRWMHKKLSNRWNHIEKYRIHCTNFQSCCYGGSLK